MWEVENGWPGETCTSSHPNKTTDSSAGLWCVFPVIPDCVDRTIYCTNPPKPAKANMTVIEQTNDMHLREIGNITFHYWCVFKLAFRAFQVQLGLLIFFSILKTLIMSFNIAILSLTILNFELEHITNMDKPSWHHTYNAIFWLLGTEISFRCQAPNYYFDYDVGPNFISFAYTDNIDYITVKCTQNRWYFPWNSKLSGMFMLPFFCCSTWEVRGSKNGLTCINLSNRTDGVLECDYLSVPDCVDRSIYCNFPPEPTEGAEVNIVDNPSTFYLKTDAGK